MCREDVGGEAFAFLELESVTHKNEPEAKLLADRLVSVVELILFEITSQRESDPTPTGTPPEPKTPHKLLTSWREITDALDLQHNEQGKVKRLNERYAGPIPKPVHDGQPIVDRDELINWWNGLAVQQQELANQRRGAELSGESYAHGKSGEVAPEIGGGVKKRRRDHKR